MLLLLNAHDWQVLRAAARAKTPPTGRELRLVPSRRTKDGTFLGEFVTAGLLWAVTPDADPFAATYALTPLGAHAAEYGEYECDLAEWKRRKAVPA